MTKHIVSRTAAAAARPLCAAPVLAVALAMTPSSAQAQDASKPILNLQQQQPPIVGAPKLITEIVVFGNKNLNADYIISASGHKVGDVCTEQTLNEIRANIFQTGNFGYPYYTEQAVLVRSEEVFGKPGCRVVIQVDESPKIDWKSKVNISGSGPIPPEEIRKLIHETAVFNSVQFNRDVVDIEKKYADAGYIGGLAPEAPILPESPDTLSIKIVVVRVHKITIARNKKTRAVTITRELKTKEGDFYNRQQWSKDLQKVFNLQLFDEVTPAEADAGPGQVDLTINVVERNIGQLLFGAGFSNRQQLIGFAQVENTNFRGLGETVRLRWETGGVANRSTVDFGYTQPWLDKKRTSLSVNLYDRVIVRFANSLYNQNNSIANTADDRRYFEQRTGATVTLARPFRTNYTAGISIRGEGIRTNSLALTSTNADILQDGSVGALQGTLLHDTRDNYLDPVAGSYQSAAISLGYADTKPVAGVDPATVNQNAFGQRPFSKAEFEFRHFISPTGPRHANKFDEPKSAFAFRVRAATSAGRLPFFEQYFLGGAESLRGYREDRFWGSSLLFGSVEFRQPFAKTLTGVFFIDAGTAWGGNYQNVQLEGFGQSGFQIHASTGVGMRVRTPLGPLRLDIGVGSEGVRTHFGIANVF